MKNINLITLTFFIVLLFTLVGQKEILFNNSDDSKNEQNKLKESARILNECIDSENKGKRGLNKSIELIEYCLKEYGFKK